MRRTIAVQLENRPGELARIVSLIAARGVNIESLAVDPLGDAALSAMSVVVNADDRTTDQLIRNIAKQVRVLSAREMTEGKELES